MSARTVLIGALIGLLAVYVAWFAPRAETVALAVFGAPVAACLAGVLLRRRTAGFWSGVLALLWFSHGVMVAWTRPGERALALAETVLAVVIVLAASVPGLRARFAGKGKTGGARDL